MQALKQQVLQALDVKFKAQAVSTEKPSNIYPDENKMTPTERSVELNRILEANSDCV